MYLDILVGVAATLVLSMGLAASIPHSTPVYTVLALFQFFDLQAQFRHINCEGYCKDHKKNDGSGRTRI